MKTGQTCKRLASLASPGKLRWGLYLSASAAACAIPQAQQLSGLRELLKVFHQTLHLERSPAIPMTAQRRRVINKLINTQCSHPSPSPAGVSFMSSPEKCALDNETIDTLVRQVWVEAYFFVLLSLDRRWEAEKLKLQWRSYQTGSFTSWLWALDKTCLWDNVFTLKRMR